MQVLIAYVVLKRTNPVFMRKGRWLNFPSKNYVFLCYVKCTMCYLTQSVKCYVENFGRDFVHVLLKFSLRAYEMYLSKTQRATRIGNRVASRPMT